MNSSFLKWGMALTISFVVHAGVASQFGEGPEEVLIEGGATAELAALGSAFVDTVESGNPDGVTEAEDVTENTLEPLETTSNNTVTEVVSPKTEAVSAFEQAETIIRSDEVLPVELPTTEAIKPSEQSELATRATSVEVPPTETPEHAPMTTEEPALSEASVLAVQSEVEPMRLASLTPAQDTSPASDPALPTVMPILENVPVPQQRETARPTLKSSPAAASKLKKKQKKKQSAKKGNKGNSSARQKSGANTGKKNARSSRDGKKSRTAKKSGNASVSNYKGKVERKLRRAVSRSKAAKNKRLRGKLKVSFVIGSGGRVNSVRIISGSGSALLDQEVLKAVRRAAPFPRIPEGAGRSSWPFVVPLTIN